VSLFVSVRKTSRDGSCAAWPGRHEAAVLRWGAKKLSHALAETVEHPDVAVLLVPKKHDLGTVGREPWAVQFRSVPVENARLLPRIVFREHPIAVVDETTGDEIALSVRKL